MALRANEGPGSVVKSNLAIDLKETGKEKSISEEGAHSTNVLCFSASCEAGC